jgi:hypothetical protein
MNFLPGIWDTVILATVYFTLAVLILFSIELLIKGIFKLFRNRSKTEEFYTNVSEVKNYELLVQFKEDIEKGTINNVDDDEYFVLLNEVEFRKNLQ